MRNDVIDTTARLVTKRNPRLATRTTETMMGTDTGTAGGIIIVTTPKLMTEAMSERRSAGAALLPSHLDPNTKPRMTRTTRTMETIGWRRKP